MKLLWLWKGGVASYQFTVLQLLLVLLDLWELLDLVAAGKEHLFVLPLDELSSSNDVVNAVVLLFVELLLVN